MSDIADRVRKIVVEHLNVDPEKVTEKASFIDDLGADSLDKVELVMAFEEEFDIEIPDDAAEPIQTVGDAVKFLEQATADAQAFPRVSSSMLAEPPPGHIVRGCRPDSPEERMRRVVVTGIGLVTPLGCGVELTWQRLSPARAAPAASTTSTSPISPARSPARGPAGRRRRRHLQSRRVDGAQGAAQGRSTFILYAMAAADAGASTTPAGSPRPTRNRTRTGVLIGSGIGGLGAIDETSHHAAREGPAPHQPVLHSRPLINLASGQVSIRYGLKGPNHSVVTACSTGAHAIGDAGPADHATATPT